MPHISIKMLEGRTDEQKELLSKNLTDAICKSIGCTNEHVSVAIEDFTAEAWQDIFKKEIAENKNIIKTPQYDPKDLLKR